MDEDVKTKALCVVWIDGEKHYYETEYASIIDVPYRNYVLI
jgi:hypothetical protein